jgi:predicted ATPase
LQDAAALYGGDLMAGFTVPSDLYESWLVVERERLHSLALDLFEHLADGCQAQGDYEQACHYAQRQVELEPWREGAYRQWMRALASQGRRSEAIAQYQACAGALREHLDLDPAQETTALYEDIRDESEVLFARTPVHNVPVALTSFVGREEHVSEVCRQLALPEVRLLTLTGVGGTGKTRLSQVVASALSDRFEDGVCFVPLAPLRDPALVLQTIARELGVHSEWSVPLDRALRDFIRNRHLLLVLDNFEHLTAAATQVLDLLQDASGLKVLVTSRAPLGVYGEREYPVPPLPLPAQRMPVHPTDLLENEAIHLFVQRAQAVRPAFAPDEENASAIAQICARLDGLPLAIELAAARIRLFSPQEILDRLGDRLEFLSGEVQGLPTRQQALRSTMDWSYHLLQDNEQMLFRRLGVFAGGFSLEAAQLVSEMSGTAELETLVGQNLVQQSSSDGESRYTLLETVREYALFRLSTDVDGEAECTHQRYATYFLSWAERLEPELYGPEQRRWLERLELEYDNLRTALKWLVENDIEGGLNLAGALGRFWQVRVKHDEGYAWLTGMLEKARARGLGESLAAAKALYAAGVLARHMGDDPAARNLHKESAALCRLFDDTRGLARATRDLAISVELADGLPLLDESIALFRQTDDTVGLARALFWRGLALLSWHQEGAYDEARASAEECRCLAREIGDISRIATANWVLSQIAVRDGDYATAQVLGEEALPLFKQAGDLVGVRVILRHLLDIALLQGDYERASDLGERGFKLRVEFGNEEGIAYALNTQGEVSRLQGDYFQATSFYELSLTLLHKLGLQNRSAAVLHNLGYTLLRQGQVTRAAGLLEQSLDLYRKRNSAHGIAICVAGLASVAIARERDTHAARLMAAAVRLLKSARSGAADEDQVPEFETGGLVARLLAEASEHLEVADRAEYEHDMSILCDRLGESALQAACRQGWKMDQEQAIALALTMERS